MERKWWLRFSILVISVLIAVAYVYPTFSKLDVTKSSFPIKQKIRLGLDLQGGIYLVLGVRFEDVFLEMIRHQVHQVRSRFKEEEIPFEKVFFVQDSPAQDPKLSMQFKEKDQDRIYALLKKEFTRLRFTKKESGVFELGLSHLYRTDVREKTINQSIEVIRNRIDEFGVSEPVIASQGQDRIIVELPGIKDIERAKALIGRTARLAFKLVLDGKMSAAQLEEKIEKVRKEKGIEFKKGKSLEKYVKRLNRALRKDLPSGTQVAFQKAGGAEGSVRLIPYLLEAKSDITGEDLADAYVQFDSQTNRPIVALSFNPRGAQVFSKLTGDHIKERLAIVLDGIVHSAPVIQSQIPNGSATITLGSGRADKMMKEAKDLAIVLRAGALPAQLSFLQERVIGPSLGQDSIEKGTYAGVIGAIFVFLLMLFYYRISGLIAVCSLFLNVLFVMAILIGMDATLTLPGIAGIALTVGIAVDSNVVIYERIREELLQRRGVLSAVEMGFQKAFRTILDANITNAGAALVLLNFGTGPIRGFAVTLLIGIVTTLFTAVFICRLFFEVYLKWLVARKAKTLSI